MPHSTLKPQVSLFLKLTALWIVPLALTFIERTLLGAQTYYGLFIGLGLVFVMYGLSIRSVFFFLQHTHREPFYVWVGYLVWSIFMSSGLAVFAFQYDLLPHTPDLSVSQYRPLIDYFYYEVITFTTVG